jgi:hypothetical protein
MGVILHDETSLNENYLKRTVARHFCPPDAENPVAAVNKIRKRRINKIVENALQFDSTAVHLNYCASRKTGQIRTAIL